MLVVWTELKILILHEFLSNASRWTYRNLAYREAGAKDRKYARLFSKSWRTLKFLN